MFNTRLNSSVRLALFLAAVMVISSCSSKNAKEMLTAEESFSRAMKKFDKGKYLDASEDLTVITLNYPGSGIVDSAQYILGECHYKMKEYIIAASEYQRLADQYPSSSLVDDAKYKIGMCYFKLSPKSGLDQENSIKCIDEFQEFTEYYPDSPLKEEVLLKIRDIRSRMAKKVYDNGMVYYKMHDFEPAIIYFNQVLDNYYDTDFAPEALLKKGESYYRMKKTEEAFAVFNKLLEKYPESSSAKKTDKYFHPKVRHFLGLW